MFQAIKQALNIVEVLEDITQTSYKASGEYTFVPESEVCPSCGHKDCFRIKHEGNNSEAFAKCFSEDRAWDVISITSQLAGISNFEAAKFLATKYGVELPKNYSPAQRIFDQIGLVYHTTLLEAGPCPELNGMTPLDYQIQIRGHTKETLVKQLVGWSDGKAIQTLSSLGFDEELLKDSGLVNKKGGDFLPAKCFIYPHLVKDKVSHFTFKDPTGRVAYQVPNKFKLNNHSFYNSDSLNLEGSVIVVEGENDVISILESGWNSPVICCNGSISTSQLEWIGLNLQGKDVITIFDNDPAGDKYREKVKKVSSGFKSLTQTRVTTGLKDIDEYLKKGGDLEGFLATQEPTSSEDASLVVDEERDPSKAKLNILVKDGSYFKRKMIDGEEKLIQLSNFTIELLNIYIQEGNREREVILHRADGVSSRPVIVNSEAKVSLKPFKSLAANTVDASFYGREEDLSTIWEYVYENSKEKVVHIPGIIGKVDEFKGWLFSDCFMQYTGAVYYPDENGVIWITNNSVGIKPTSLVSSKEFDINTGIPSIRPRLEEEEERIQLVKDFTLNFGKNLGELGDSIIILSWLRMSLYAKECWPHIKNFPFLFLWGESNKGKSTIIRWLLSIYNMDAFGSITLGSYGSGVSFSRRVSYYSALPLCIDEMRSDLHDMKEFEATARGWYDRIPKSVASGANKVTEQPIRSTFIFSGQDQFTDAATRSRCIPVRIGRPNRETKETYKWILNQQGNLSDIGFHFISKYAPSKFPDIMVTVREKAEILRERGVNARASVTWGLLQVFGEMILEECGITYNYQDYIYSAATTDSNSQVEDSVTYKFWSVAEGLQSMTNPVLSGDHFRREGDLLHVWFPEVYRLIERSFSISSGEKFSRHATREAIKEEPYFVGEDRKGLGMGEVQRRVLTLDLTKAPIPLQNIASYLG